jgi:hypothetical protein
VNGVVQKSDGTTEQATKDFGDNQSERRDHRPTQDRRAHGRMGVAVRVIVGMVVGVVMPVSVHRHIVRVWGTECSPPPIG